MKPDRIKNLCILQICMVHEEVKFEWYEIICPFVKFGMRTPNDIESISGNEEAKFQFHPPSSRYVHRVNYVRIEEPVAGTNTTYASVFLSVLVSNFNKPTLIFHNRWSRISSHSHSLSIYDEKLHRYSEISPSKHKFSFGSSVVTDFF